MGGELTSFGVLPSLFGVFVETGTYLGITTREAAKNFRRVHTIELDPTILERTKAELSKFKNVDFILGDSGKMLEPLCSSISEPAVFFLDAHYAGGPAARGEKEAPLYEELAHIAQRPYQDLVIIDDYRLFGKEGTSGTDGTMYPLIQFDWRDITVSGCFDVLHKNHRSADYKIEDDRVYLLLHPRAVDISSTDGACRILGDTLLRDPRILEQALAIEHDELLIARYTFQLARSYQSSGEIEKALETYLARARLGGDQGEVFRSLYVAAQLKEQLAPPEQEVIDAYLEAASVKPTRAEALYGASRFCRIKGRYEEGFQLARQGLAIGRPSEGYIQSWIYDCSLLEELALNGYWSGHYRESLDACVKLLASEACPPDQRERIAANARFALEKLPPDLELGSLSTEESIKQPETLEEDPGNHRYWFYLAQCYRDAGRTAEAARAYAKRAEMGGRDEEAWNARLQEARCLRTLGDEGSFVLKALAAHNMQPQRAEPLYDLARFYREKGMHEASVLFSEAGLTIGRPEHDTLFLEDFVYAAGLQEEYSIAAYYARDPAREDRGFAACNWLALNRSIPDGSRWLAWSNLFFYVRPASTMLPSFAARPVGFDPPGSYHPLNPSVTRLGQQIFVMLRTANYELIDDWYVMPDNAPGHTRNFLLRLSEDLDTLSAAEVLPPADMPEPAYPALGFQDMRLFVWRGELWGSGCLYQLTAKGCSEQVLARIGELAPGSCRLTDWRVLCPEGPRVQQDEKNWMPQVAGDRLQFVYLCEPTRVVDDRGSTVTETTPAIAAGQFRGSSQLIAFDGGWLALIHEVPRRPSDRRRCYHHRFLWFDETNRLCRVSRPFFFHTRGVEFAAGVVWHPDGERLLISYGVADSEAWIATVNAAEVRDVLEDADHLPSGNSEDAAINLPGPENRPVGAQTTFNAQRREV